MRLQWSPRPQQQQQQQHHPRHTNCRVEQSRDRCNGIRHVQVYTGLTTLDWLLMCQLERRPSSSNRNGMRTVCMHNIQNTYGWPSQTTSRATCHAIFPDFVLSRFCRVGTIPKVRHFRLRSTAEGSVAHIRHEKYLKCDAIIDIQFFRQQPDPRCNVHPCGSRRRCSSANRCA